MKKEITVLVNKYATPEYLEFLKERFEIKVINYDDYRAGKVKGNDIDLILYTGGADVNPDYYNERLGKYTSIDKRRDELERYMYAETEYCRALKLGICRGSQFLTVMSGGSLVQHVDGHGRPHDISIAGWGAITLKVTSTHHQMMYPYALPSSKYELIGWSTFFQASTYLDGRNEEKDLPKDFLEPEIVYYNNTHSLAVQGHPEFREADPKFKAFVLDQVESYLSKARV